MAYDIAWVADKDSPVDTINGFIENYLDARGVKGAWEALVFYVNREKTEGLQRLAEAAAWFEERMPWDPQWRRSDVVGVTARAIDVDRRDRRCRAGDADRHQPAERPAHSRAARQQVGVAGQHQRGVREVAAAGLSPGVLLVGRGSRRAPSDGARSASEVDDRRFTKCWGTDRAAWPIISRASRSWR